MKPFLYTAVAIGFSLSVAAQAGAMETSGATCADFMAMTHDGQVAALDKMKMSHDDMASDGMASDDMASDDMASDDMASDDMASDDMESDDMMSEDMTAMMSACEGNPDMKAMDAMKSAMDY